MLKFGKEKQVKGSLPLREHYSCCLSLSILITDKNMFSFFLQDRLFNENPLQASLQDTSKPQIHSLSKCLKKNTCTWKYATVALHSIANVDHGMSLLRWNKKKVFSKCKW